LSAHHYVETTGRWGLRSEWSHVLGAELLSASTWIPLTVLALWLAHRFPLGRPSVIAVAAHLGGLLVAVMGRVQVAVALAEWLGCYPALPPADELLATTGQQHAFTYLLVTGVGHGLYYATAHRRREQELVWAELTALRAQMRPHFLFNALNAIAALVHEDPGQAERMIANLGTLLRRSIQSGEEHLVPLRTELDLLRAYLEIEQTRYGDRLRISWDIDPRALDIPVPPLVLQPLAENAVRHGLGLGGGHLRIGAHFDDEGTLPGRLRLEVEDDGLGLPTATTVAEGIGLGNTRARLRRAYGTDHELVVAPRPGGGVVVTIALPPDGAPPVRPRPSTVPVPAS
jgi:signal transduction histidine kinase